MHKLAPSLRPLFDDFVRGANKAQLNRRDWEHFYDFIRGSHSRQAKLEDGELRRLFAEAGFDDEFAAELASLYHHGRAILAGRWRWWESRWWAPRQRDVDGG